MKELLEYLARSLVDNPDAVSVEVEEDEDEVALILTVDESDMGRVIGRDGRIANAIRALLRVAAARDGRHVELEIEASGLDAGQESRFLDAMDLRVESTAAGEILVESIFGDMDQKPAQLSFAARLRVWLPQEVSVDVENRFGAVEVAERGGGSKQGAVRERVEDVHGAGSRTIRSAGRLSRAAAASAPAATAS